MKHFVIYFFVIFIFKNVTAQTITNLGPDHYQSIQIDWPGYNDYTKSIILIHEMYNGILLQENFAVGTLTAKRGSTGAYNRLAVIQLNSSSVYNQTFAHFSATTSDEDWKLRTCTFNNKKYLALEIPYSAACYSQGFYFTGWIKSTGETMKCIPYEINGQAVNQNILSNIQDYQELGLAQKIFTNQLEITGKVGIGTTNLTDALNVNGTIHTKEVKVDMNGWSDFVFKPDYPLKSIQDLKNFIKINGHLPDIPDEKTVVENGIHLGEINKKLLQKIEELTLYLIQKDEEVKKLEERMNKLENLR